MPQGEIGKNATKYTLRLHNMWMTKPFNQIHASKPHIDKRGCFFSETFSVAVALLLFSMTKNIGNESLLSIKAGESLHQAILESFPQKWGPMN